MPRKHHKRQKQNISKKESFIEGFKRLEIKEQKESKVREFLIRHEDPYRKRFLKRWSSENNLKINTESLKLLCSRSEPCLHDATEFRRGEPLQRRKQKKLRFFHEVIVMSYHKNKPAVQCVQPLADEWDQQKRSYKYRGLIAKLNYPITVSNK